MVIPVCYKCKTPVKIISTPQGGLEIINYQCPECNHVAASFLLGYIEPALEASPQAAPADEELIERAKYFEDTYQHYKLRAKMQGLLELRAAADGRRQNKPADDSAESD